MSYIKTLEKYIHYYHLQEQSTPEKFAGCTADSNPAEWQRACDCWDQWMGEVWLEVARAHAGGALSDSEILQQYGEWKDRAREPGKRLLMIIRKDDRPKKSD